MTGVTQQTRRDMVEGEVLRHVQKVVFSPEAVAYLTRRVSAVLQHIARQRPASDGQRKRRELDLAATLSSPRSRALRTMRCCVSRCDKVTMPPVFVLEGG